MTNKNIHQVNLALQGGGSHGAFTWGVLDRLLEEEDICIEGISGTSAGAMNAAVLATGYGKDGRYGAKKSLNDFWWNISQLGQIFSPFKGSLFQNANHNWNLDWSLSYNAFELMSHILSPYQMNPLNMNPLRWVLEKTIDVDRLQKCPDIKVFIAATAVQSGQPRIFKHHEITVEVLLASACIPTLFHAIIIDNEPYWDGGYMGNPTVWPLTYFTNSSDVILVQINPLFRQGTPQHSYEIMNRLNEINFNSSLIAEMRAIHFVSKLLKEGKLDPKDYKDLKIHLITEGDRLLQMNASSKMNASWDFFKFLHQIGYEQTHKWIKKYKSFLGKKSSIDIQKTFLNKQPGTGLPFFNEPLC